MSEEINISCLACNAAFCVPVEFCGETAECDECGKNFTIQYPGKTTEGNLEKTDTGPVDDDLIQVTHTVKLSRSGIGMIPEIDDAFQLGVPHPSAAKTATKPKPAAAKSKARKAPEEAMQAPEWTHLDIKEAEKILGLKEDINYSWKTPLMICTAVISGIILAHFAGILIVIVFVFVVAATFAISGKNKKALIVTNQRSIFIIDKTRIEVNNFQ